MNMANNIFLIATSSCTSHLGIPKWFLKDFAFAVANPVCHIFNASLTSGLVPDLWKRAGMVPVPKSHPPKSINEDMMPMSLAPNSKQSVGGNTGSAVVAINH
jgi:hypothetical protein